MSSAFVLQVWTRVSLETVAHKAANKAPLGWGGSSAPIYLKRLIMHDHCW